MSYDMSEIGLTTPVYPRDAEVLAKMTPERRIEFEAWMKALDAEHEKMEAPYGYGSLWTNTGIECWLSCFEDGDDPRDALLEDLSNAE